MLAGLPVLTHLAVNSSTDLDVYVYFFSVRKSLDALILLRRPRVSGSAELDILCDNPHFVMMPVEHYKADWQRGVLVGDNYWARADALIAKRMSTSP
jgi:hypothetical protein